jgi:hypothetical protein
MDHSASTPHEPLDGPTDSLIKPGWDSHDSTHTDSTSESEHGHDKSQYPIAPWDICWHDKPATAVSLFLIGLSCAIGQHVFYSMKDGTLATQQEWTIRVGTGLAYLLGFSMAALVGISRDQWVWRTLRTRFFPLESIDALFGVTSNVFCFLDLTMVWNAKVSTMLAALKWLFPLVTIFTPSTISVILTPFDTEFDCQVPALSFPGPRNSTDLGSTVTTQGHDLTYSGADHSGDDGGEYGDNGDASGVPTLRNMRRANAFANQRLYVADIYDPAAYTNQNVSINNYEITIDAESKDCYVNAEVLRYFIMSAYSSEVIFPPDITRDHLISEECSVNCTYSYDFVGPSINCTEFESIPKSLSDIYQGISDQNIILFGAGQGSDLNSTGLDSTYTADDRLYSPERLWAFYSSANDSCLPRESRSLHAYTCEFGPARYWINQSISDRFLQPHIKVDPIDNSTFSLDERATCVLLQALREILGGYLVITYDPPLYKKTESKNYTITVPIASNRTNIRSTNLMDKSGLNVVDPLGDSIEKMVHKMVVSLIADDGLNLAKKVSTRCRATKMQNTYVYKPLILILVNTTAMFFSALVAVLGALALVQNGVASDTSFSTFLRTTRNPTLDRALRGGSLGGSSFRKKFSGLKLKYGELSVKGKGVYGDGVRHVGMGVEGEVSTMQKGRNYY